MRFSRSPRGVGPGGLPGPNGTGGDQAGAASPKRRSANVRHQQTPDHNLSAREFDDESTTTELPEADLDTLRTVADWITTFVAQPNIDLGRSGPVCPSCLEP